VRWGRDLIWPLVVGFAVALAAALAGQNLVLVLVAGLAVSLLSAVALTAWDWRRGRLARREAASAKLAYGPEPPPPPLRSYGLGPRVYADVTPEELTAFFKDVTEFQGQQMVQKYIGQWMRVRGPLGGAREEKMGQVRVTFSDRGKGTPQSPVYASFRGPGLDRLLTTLQGRKLTVDGQIAVISRHWVQLDSCELVDEDSAAN
jgi:hypothetical protein